MNTLFLAGSAIVVVLTALWLLEQIGDARMARRQQAEQDRRAWEDRKRRLRRARERGLGLPPADEVRHVIDQETSWITSTADELDDCA